MLQHVSASELKTETECCVGQSSVATVSTGGTVTQTLNMKVIPTVIFLLQSYREKNKEIKARSHETLYYYNHVLHREQEVSFLNMQQCAHLKSLWPSW